jgi:predicted phage terminase large subunit-like protein
MTDSNNFGSIDPAIIESLIADQKVRREVTRQKHIMFFSVYFGEYVTYKMAPFHWTMFDLTECDSRMVGLMAFRGSGKSTIFTLSYPIWAILGVLKKKFVIIVAQTQQQAKLYITNIKRELECNDLLRQDLGPFTEGEEEWSSGSLVFSNHNARITALSTEQSIRGLRHGANRPDLIICDDLEDLASVKTYEGRSKMYQWLIGDVIPAGDLKTKVVVIGNMLHDDSILMRLKRDIESGKRDGVFQSFPFFQEDGSPSWPGKFTNAASVSALQSAIGDDGAWSREFLLKIISDAEQVVHPDWIHTYEGDAPVPPHPQYQMTGVGIDLAISMRDTADFTAMVCARIVGGVMYVLPNPVNEHLTFPDTIERVKTINNAFGTKERRHIYVENVGYQEAAIQQLNKDGVRVEGVNPQGQDKRARIALTTHNIKSGLILFPKHGAEELIRQLVGFGKESHDDLADAFTILAIKFSEYLHVPTASIFFLEGDPEDRGWHSFLQGLPTTNGIRTKQF